MEQDKDLAPLHELESYQKLAAELRVPAAKQAKIDAAKALAENEPFEFTFSLPSVQGGTVSLSDHRGHVVIVDFWGTWCPPCRMEVPHFVRLEKEYREQGLRIVGINDEQDAPKDEWPALIQTAIEELDIPYPCLIGDDETKSQVPGFRAFPTTLFIDRAGKVRAKTEGYRSYYELEAIVQTLLNEVSASSAPAAPE
jgi:thiol-disulfide isomerase/thioredoxin